MENNLLHQMLQQQQQQQQQNQQQTPSDFTMEENQFQQHPHNQNSPNSPPANILNFKPGIFNARICKCILDRSGRPADNNLEFWENFVAEHFAPNAKNICCLSSYGNCQNVDEIFHQAEWNCSICGCKPGRGFELPYELLPRLLQIYYEIHSKEYLWLTWPFKYRIDAGQVILHYDKAVHDSKFDNQWISREGQLRVVFNPDQKISSWEFCARSHEEFICLKFIKSQVKKLSKSAHNYTAISSSSDLSIQDIQDFYNSCEKCSFDLAKTIKNPEVTPLGYSRKYVHALQSLTAKKNKKELIDYSIQTGTGPRESLEDFVGGNSAQVGLIGSSMSVKLGEPSRKDFTADNSSGISAAVGPTTSQQDQVNPAIRQDFVKEEMQENFNEVQSPRTSQQDQVNPAIRQDFVKEEMQENFNEVQSPRTSQQDQVNPAIRQDFVKEEMRENFNEVQSPGKDQ